MHPEDPESTIKDIFLFLMCAWQYKGVDFCSSFLDELYVSCDARYSSSSLTLVVSIALTPAGSLFNLFSSRQAVSAATVRPFPLFGFFVIGFRSFLTISIVNF